MGHMVGNFQPDNLFGGFCDLGPPFFTSTKTNKLQNQELLGEIDCMSMYVFHGKATYVAYGFFLVTFKIYKLPEPIGLLVHIFAIYSSFSIQNMPLQDLVGRDSGAKKKDVALAQKLQEKMSKMSHVYYHNEQPPIKEARACGYRTKPCFKLGVCVCGENRALGQFCQHLSKYMMAHFVLLKEKVDGKRKFSDARTLLRNRMVVLRFQCFDPGEDLQQQEMPLSKQIRPTDRFMHIGHVNFNSWHFCCMTMFPLSEAIDEADPVIQLIPQQPEDDEIGHGVATETEFVKAFLTLDQQWVVDVLIISLEERHWLPENIAAVPARWFTSIAPFRLWQGVDAEMRPRKKRKKTDAIEDGPALLAMHDLQGTDDDTALQNPNPYDDNLAEDKSDGNDPDSAGEVVSDIESPGDCSASRDSSESEHEVVQVVEGDVRQNHPSSVANDADDPSSVAPAAPAEDADDPSVAPDGPSSVAPAEDDGRRASAKVHRDMFSTVSFHVNGGVLRFYPQNSVVTAFCDHPGHGDCRRSRTVRQNEASRTAMQRGQGRPIGLLCSWLELQMDHSSQQDHVHNCNPTATQRVAAREKFLQMPGALDFSQQAERPQREGEDIEPAKIR